jgi:hypothetical protein
MMLADTITPSQRAPSPADRYLTLMKSVITDTVFGDGPDPDTLSAASYVQGLVSHCIRGDALTLVPTARLDNIQKCIEDVIASHVAGDVMEAGVWRGGTAIFMKAVLDARDSGHRQLWVADSFEGLPVPDAELHPVEARAHDSKLMREIYQHFAVGLEEVQGNFARFGLLDERVKFLKGWFKNTLPTAPLGPLSVIRLDGDYYDSTMDCLVNLYDKLSPGGYMVVDDYGQDDWTYCRKAVDEFRETRRITDPMIKVDSTCYFWQRAA